MALINCPECGTEVSDKAEKCPKCAYPLNMANNDSGAASAKPESRTEVVVKAKEGCFLQTLNIGCMLVAGVIGLIILLFMLKGCSH